MPIMPKFGTDLRFFPIIKWHPNKAEAVRISKNEELSKQIIEENETKLKQWKARVIIFMKSVKGWV